MTKRLGDILEELFVKAWHGFLGFIVLFAVFMSLVGAWKLGGYLGF